MMSTLPEMYRPMMGRPSVKADRCAVCGRRAPLNDHHVVKRSAGKLFDERGREVKKPTVTLCGFGNNLMDADGNHYCHGLAHAGRLHFRWVEAKTQKKSLTGNTPLVGAGHWEYLLTDEPTKYQTALEMKGWRRL